MCLREVVEVVEVGTTVDMIEKLEWNEIGGGGGIGQRYKEAGNG